MGRRPVAAESATALMSQAGSGRIDLPTNPRRDSGLPRTKSPIVGPGGAGPRPSLVCGQALDVHRDLTCAEQIEPAPPSGRTRFWRSFSKPDVTSGARRLPASRVVNPPGEARIPAATLAPRAGPR